ncbi:MAG: winged helix-turn-helix domain-containing protein [Phycisphaeraceae bacterium]|nr:winged helix-turn-helix domain-containing protein [Phycisphaeraceae bacterium]
MKKNEVQIGKVYLAMVSDKVVPVRIDAENPHGGWDGTNMSTNKKVRIKSPQRLRGLAPDRQASQRNRAVAEARASDAAANAHAIPAEAATPTKAAKTRKTANDPKPKKISGLDAAAEILKASGGPMRCKDIVQAMLDKGLWKTGGATPQATIYAAMHREIATKGKDARFAKVERGKFTLVAGQQPPF